MTADQYLDQLDVLRWSGQFQAALDLAMAQQGIALTPVQRTHAEVALAYASRMLALEAAERSAAPTPTAGRTGRRPSTPGPATPASGRTWPPG